MVDKVYITGGQDPSVYERALTAPQGQFDITIPGAPASQQPTQDLDFDVGPDDSRPVASEKTLSDRSDKFKYGLGDILQKSRDEIYEGLQRGEEGLLREQAAGEINKRKQDTLQKVLTSVATNKKGPLTPEEIDGLSQIVGGLQPDTDPSTVLETAYGKQFMAQLDRTAQGSQDNIWTQAQIREPEATARIQAGFENLISKREVVQQQLQDAQDEVEDQSWMGWGFDQFKTAIPGYTDWSLRAGAAGTGIFAGGALGWNLEQQRRNLFEMPIGQFKTELMRSTAGMTPIMKREYLTAMLGVTTDDVTVKNWQLPLEFLGLGIGSKVGKYLYKKVTGETAELPLTPRVVRTNMMTGQEVSDVRRAAEDMVRAAAEPNASRSTFEAASGDLQQSAVTRATSNAIADRQNLPEATKRAVEALPGTLRADMDNVRARPGRLGQDIVNRLDEQTNDIAHQLQDVALTVQKVERLPEVLSNETAVRLILDNMKNTYRGLKNAVLDMSNIYKEEVSNTYLVDMKLGNADGTYFKNRQVAENFIDFHGLRGSAIEEGKDVNFTKPVVEYNKYTKNIADAQKIIERERARANDPSLSEAKRAKAAETVTATEEYIVDQAMERKALGPRDQMVSVEQQGLGYYVKITKPVNETDPVVRQFLAQTTNTRIPDSPISQFLNSYIGKYRTPEEVLSLAERQNRLAVTYAPSVYFELMKKNSQEILKLSRGRFTPKGRKMWEEWQRGLENAMELPDELDATKRGYFFKDPAEMETYWQQWFQRLPEEQEIAAYFEFKRGMEIDRVMRNIAEHRNQQRVGAETHRISVAGPEGQVFSQEFSGVVRNKLPGAEDNIAIIGSKQDSMTVKALERMSTKEKKELQDDIDRGVYQLIELYNPELRPLNGFGDIGDSRIRYVLAESVETRPLDWNHIPRRGGGHVQYEYEHYIKQPKIRYDEVGGRHWYEGDTTVMAVPVHKMGAKVAEHLNNIRKLLADKNESGAMDYNNRYLHVDWDTVKGWFVATKDETGKVIPPRLSLKEDIMVIPRNKKATDIDNNLRFKYANFKDGTKEGSLARNNRVDFTEERDAYEMLQIDDVGSRGNPLYQLSPASKIDPITTMNRGLSRIARSNFMDDYKTMAVEHWLQQAKAHLDVKSEGEIYHSPFYQFQDGKFRPGTDPQLRARLEANKYHIDQLVGQPTVLDGVLHSTAQKLVDLAYNTAGPRGLVLDPTWVLSKLRDPTRFLRSVVHNMKLGLFNIPQMIVQMGNYSNILGVAGYRYAASGTMAAQLHFWSTVNSHPNIINRLDELATKLKLPGTSNWRPGEFREALEELNKTGFANTGGEYATLDSPTSAKVVSSAGQTFLDWGQLPFQAGERNSKYGAWYTAFKEWRDNNPTGRITNDDRAAILQRADLLNVNMSRASSSAIHKGVFSIPTQFYTYQIRLMELMFGSRLSAATKARMFATNAVLYGIPMATGLTGLPVADYIRSRALDNGYVVGDDYVYSMLMEGVPSALGAVISGKGDPSLGNYYDVGQRFGTKGFEFLGGLGRSDKGYLDIVGGPLYSTFKGFIDQTDGLNRWRRGLMSSNEDDLFPLAPEDFIDPLRQISSVNLAARTYAAINFGRWVSAKDAWLADSSKANAVFSALTGLKDTRINDIQTMSNDIRNQEDHEKVILDQFRQELRRGMLAMNSNNPEGAEAFFKRAKATLIASGVREDRISSIVNQALGDNQSLLDKLDFQYYIKKAPQDSIQTRQEAFQRLQRLKDRRGEN